MKKIFLLIAVMTLTVFIAGAQTVSLITQGTSWKYLSNGSNQGTAWRATSFNDAIWSTGNAQLGYGDGDEATVIPYGPSSWNKYITYYFRKSFTVANPASITSLSLNIKRDDGAVVYLNGTEIQRTNMPSGTITYTTRASTTVSGSGETTFYASTESASLLLTGTNVIAVEVHQVNPSGPDVSFDLFLNGTQTATCATPTGLSATSITSNSATLNWAAVTGAVSYNIQYRIVGTSTWTTTTSTTNSKAISSLSPASNYEFQVQTVCSGSSSAFSASSTFTTLSVVTCNTPTGLSATTITSSSATLNWAAVAGAVSYNIHYRKVGTPTWTSTTSATNSKAISSLTPASVYEFQVQTVCSGSSSAFSASANFTTLALGTDTLITTNSSWKYLDNGSNQGTAWQATSFNDGTWALGNAELGYGDGGEATVVSYGPNSSAKYITSYFRKAFNVTNAQAYASLTLGFVRDDGIVVYINGTEAYRNNMPTGTISYTTLSPVAIGGADESAWNTANLSTSAIVTGTNVIAVEIHQQAGTSTDISFNLRLYATGQPTTTPVVTRGAYLQRLTPNSITIRWRTNIASNSNVQYGTTISHGNNVSDAAVTTEHIVNITGLTPATKYYYSIGTTFQVLQGDTNNNFYTAPVTGTVMPVRIWAIGDFGNGSTSQDNVRNAYMNYAGAHATNLWLWLGDNAYATGTDTEFQNNVFNKYPTQFKKFPHFPSIGNHDYAQSGYQSAAALGTNFPYFNIFSVPQSGEAGGVASNTPKYYSYNYANIHFIALDSYGSLNNTTSPMYTWLNNDLAANTQRWTIVYFHHPPYTKGTHNSDNDIELINMRTNIVPLLESYHVDLVLCGHSHINERSYMIKGHYGLANTFTAAMKVSASTNTFTKSPPFDGTVYATCGTSGQNPGATQSGYPMPCMYFNNNTNNCSLVMDVNGDNLSCKYLTSSGTIADQFTITKSGLKIAQPIPQTTSMDAFFVSEENAVYLNYFLTEDAKVSFELLNLHGDKISSFSKLPTNQSKGHYSEELLLSDSISNGVYFVIMNVNEEKFTKKLVIAK